MTEQGKTPIPKSQREISEGLQDPSTQTYGVPNDFTKFDRS